jgi:hypothetical protein
MKNERYRYKIGLIFRFYLLWTGDIWHWHCPTLSTTTTDWSRKSHNFGISQIPSVLVGPRLCCFSLGRSCVEDELLSKPVTRLRGKKPIAADAAHWVNINIASAVNFLPFPIIPSSPHLHHPLIPSSLYPRSRILCLTTVPLVSFFNFFNCKKI